ncbi:hypothetical protein SNEBB_000935 [Seison nebaliae]|nr:hypothetical protein SNEBB_000935 [Seison nebaliae]
MTLNDHRSNLEESDEDEDNHINLCVVTTTWKKMFKFPSDRLIWTIKKDVIESCPPNVSDPYNMGLYLPPSNGRAGKFLDEARLLNNYPLQSNESPFVILEFKYKRRIYKILNINETKIKSLHTEKNLCKFLHNIKSQNVNKVLKLLNKGLDPNFHSVDTKDTPLTLAIHQWSESNNQIEIHSQNTNEIHKINNSSTSDYSSNISQLSSNFSSFSSLPPKGQNEKKFSRVNSALNTTLRRNNTNYTQRVNNRVEAFKQIVLMLVEHGAHLDYRTMTSLTPLHVAVQRNNLAAVKILLSLGASPNVYDTNDLTPLWYSMSSVVCLPIIRLLLHDHAIVNDLRDPSGNSIVHEAVIANSAEKLEQLIFYGAILDQQNQIGNTPLHVAVLHRHEACVRMLLFRGADCTITNDMNLTPKQIAEKEKLTSFVKMFKNFKKKNAEPFCGLPVLNSKRRSIYFSSTFLNDRSLSVQNKQSISMNEEKLVFDSKYHRKKILRNSERERTYSSLSHSSANAYGGQSTNDYSENKRKCKKLVRTVQLEKSDNGYGFVLRGPRTLNGVNMETNRPSAQFLEHVTTNSVADLNNLYAGDYVLSINGVDVREATHDTCVKLIQNGSNVLSMTVMSTMDNESMTYDTIPNHYKTYGLTSVNIPNIKKDGKSSKSNIYNTDDMNALAKLDATIAEFESTVESSNENSLLRKNAQCTSLSPGSSTSSSGHSSGSMSNNQTCSSSSTSGSSQDSSAFHEQTTLGKQQKQLISCQKLQQQQQQQQHQHCNNDKNKMLNNDVQLISSQPPPPPLRKNSLQRRKTKPENFRYIRKQSMESSHSITLSNNDKVDSRKQSVGEEKEPEWMKHKANLRPLGSVVYSRSHHTFDRSSHRSSIDTTSDHSEKENPSKASNNVSSFVGDKPKKSAPKIPPEVSTVQPLSFPPKPPEITEDFVNSLTPKNVWRTELRLAERKSDRLNGLDTLSSTDLSCELKTALKERRSRIGEGINIMKGYNEIEKTNQRKDLNCISDELRKKIEKRKHLIDLALDGMNNCPKEVKHEAFCSVSEQHLTSESASSLSIVDDNLTYDNPSNNNNNNNNSNDIQNKEYGNQSTVQAIKSNGTVFDPRMDGNFRNLIASKAAEKQAKYQLESNGNLNDNSTDQIFLTRMSTRTTTFFGDQSTSENVSPKFLNRAIPNKMCPSINEEGFTSHATHLLDRIKKNTTND